MLVGIQDEILRLQSMGLLEQLLADRTTKTNIIWGTDAYAALGNAYQKDKEIHADLITGRNSDTIKTRARKAMEQQSERTRKHAEVFTPLWICKKMVSYADAAWFGKADAFLQGEQPTEQVLFHPKRKWQHYVDARRLEITCGEAPYLVNRYDVSSGEEIPLENRMGILDRKLRVVNENAADEEEWLKWAQRAFESTYGYEFQGDNLLIARVNLLMTYEEYLFARWKRKPAAEEYREIEKTITWNIWQMDGLNGKIPYCKAPEEYCQLSFFELLESEDYQEKANTQPPCRIYDWRRGSSLEYRNVNQGGRNMKFDFIIGNPPYQEEQEGDNKTFAPPIYHKFLENAYQISDVVEMIHPARFLFNAGSTPKAWNEQMLSDVHLKVLYYEPDASKVFLNTDIKGGISITYHDWKSDFGSIETFAAYDELNSLRKKVVAKKEDSLAQIVYTQVRFDLDNLYADYPNFREVIGSDGKDKRFRNNIFEKIQIFDDKETNDTIRVLGISKNKRVWKYILRKYVDENHENLHKWKVLVPMAGGSGAIGETLSTPIICAPLIGYTQSFIGIGAFNGEDEATACYKYIKSRFARVLLGILKITQHCPPAVWRMIPLQDFTSSSDIDWSKSIAEIDRQLYVKYGLDEKEIAFIESHVKEMA